VTQNYYSVIKVTKIKENPRTYKFDGNSKRRYIYENKLDGGDLKIL
jgi:hypothetical protein